MNLLDEQKQSEYVNTELYLFAIPVSGLKTCFILGPYLESDVFFTPKLMWS